MVIRSAEVRLDSTAQTAGRARRFVTATLARWQIVAAAMETIVLLTSEVVTNAVRHGRGAVSVVVEQHKRTVRVSVQDQHRDLPRLLPIDDDSERGRGLWLVEALAKRWGTKRLPDGKHVWFDVEIQNGARRGGAHAGGPPRAIDGRSR
jgi:anti-sigma regulatory factor (Ser/Thr protein kinase)